ncbi:MAG: hypothetical protein ACRDJ9_20925, partial [Dehalococcoidia bacterium]
MIDGHDVAAVQGAAAPRSPTTLYLDLLRATVYRAGAASAWEVAPDAATPPIWITVSDPSA